MLQSLLAEEEGKTIEFKENANSLNRILQTIVAFANTAGGTLVIGVRDKTKEVVGVKDVLKEEERIANAVADSIVPLLSPNFQFYTWRNREVLLITVAHTVGPFYLRDKGKEKGVYVRLGSTNRVADQNTVADIQRLSSHQSFDELPDLKANQNDIDFSVAEGLFLQVGKKFNLNTAKTLGLLVHHNSHVYPSYGALLLFAKNRRKFFPDAIIRCGLFAGNTKTTIIDQQEINLPLPNALEAVMSFITRNTQIKSEIEHIRRVDIPQYSPIVIREAVTNAIVHTDYSLKGANIEIAIYEDRLEITNPGALPFGLSLEKALQGISQLRNRVIGHVFRELNLIERWGSGLSRMIEISHNLNVSKPKFEELDHYFRVTIYHDAKHLSVAEPWQQKIIDYLKKHQNITTKDASKLWEVTDRTASTRLKNMCKLGMIVEISTGPYDPKKIFILFDNSKKYILIG